MLWYVAYGSNLSWDRFRLYLEGGTPAGAQTTYPGARDPSPPQDDRPVVLRHGMRFAGRSTNWGGGVAFLDPEASQDETLGRAWLVTRDQFEDVVSQENDRTLGLRLPELRAETHDLGVGWYRLVVPLGELDDIPMWTVTGPERNDVTAPSAAYLRHVIRGLCASHGLTAAEAGRYLLGVAGIAGAFSEADLVGLVG